MGTPGLEFINELIPVELLKLSVFLAATSGFFFFGWNRIILPVFQWIHRTRYHEISFQLYDGMFKNVEIWLAKNKKHCYFARNHKVSEVQRDDYDEDEILESAREFRMIPGFGSFFFWRRGTPPMVVTRSKEQKQGVERDGELVHFRIFTSSEEKVRAIFDEMRAASVGDPSESVRMYIYNSWCASGRRKEVPYLVSKKTKDLCRDMEEFLSPERKEMHEKRQIPYRRGYLLSGPPGTGKSNFVVYASKKFNLPIFSVASSIGSNGTISMFNSMGNGMKILLMEDIDMSDFGKKRDEKEEHQYEEKSNLKDLRMFLNMLDGIMVCDNFICICTTNHIERLDDALLRPGRIDVVSKLEYLTPQEQVDYFNLFYVEEKECVGNRVENMKHRPVAEVSRIFSENPNDAYNSWWALTRR